jgi:N-acetylmuramic acid 6-phosphate (MurNAc-6-P) etherase
MTSTQAERQKAMAAELDQMQEDKLLVLAQDQLTKAHVALEQARLQIDAATASVHATERTVRALVRLRDERQLKAGRLGHA